MASSIFISSHLLLVIISILSIHVSAKGDRFPPAVNLNADTGTRAELLRGIPQAFCYNGRDSYSIAGMFEQVDIIAKTDESFSYYDVRGIGSDDFHSVIERFVFGIFLNEEERAEALAEHQSDSTAYEKTSFIRDLVSSCPSPLSYESYKKCTMQFSPYGRSCITVSMDRSADVEVDTIVRINMNLVVNLFSGLILFALAHALSKSKVFQYSTGSFLFVVAGLLVVAYIIINRFIIKNGNGFNIATLIAATGYGWAFIHMLKNHLRELLIRQWEILLGYICICALIGIITVNIVRRNESTKHAVRISAKWILRSVALVLVYNSSASPSGSLAMVAGFIGLYTMQRLLAAGGKPSKDYNDE